MDTGWTSARAAALLRETADPEQEALCQDEAPRSLWKGVRPQCPMGPQPASPPTWGPAAGHAQAHSVSVSKFLLSTFLRTAGRL